MIIYEFTRHDTPALHARKTIKKTIRIHSELKLFRKVN